MTCYQQGFLTGDVDLGFTDCLHSRLPPTHNESHKVQVLLRASDANVEVGAGFLVADFCWHCGNGSPSLSLQHSSARTNLNLVLGSWECQVQLPVPVGQTGEASIALYLFLRISKMSDNFSLYLFLKASFSLCYRQNHISCYHSSFRSCWLNILPAACKLNLGPNIIAFTSR